MELEYELKVTESPPPLTTYDSNIYKYCYYGIQLKRRPAHPLVHLYQ